MKQIKFLMIALAILVATTLTSCLSSSNGDYPDLYGIYTVKSSYGYSYLVDNSGEYEFYPSTGSSALDGASERVFAYIQLKEGDKLSEDKKRYNDVTIMYGSVGSYPVKSLCDLPDTIENSYPLYDLLKDTYASSDHINVVYKSYYKSNLEHQDFELCVEDFEDDVLYLSFKHTVGEGGEYNYSEKDHLYCFRIPSVSELNSILLADGKNVLTNVQDSIKVQIFADGKSNELKTSQFKFKTR